MGSAVVTVESIQRRMRGGSQALLVRGADDQVYVAKCAGNPQGTRTLINEWVVTRLLKLLQARTPELHLLRFETGVPGESLLEFRFGNRRIPIARGLHLGSRCPVDPERVAIFDFLPRRLLSRIVNVKDFTLAFVLDKWVSQTDSRQAIFVRERTGGDQSAKFGAYLIDHGMSFGGTRWEFSDAPFHGVYYDRSIYDPDTLTIDCHAAVAQIRALPESAISAASQDVPLEWFEAGDRDKLARLLEALVSRRAKLDEIVDRALEQISRAGKILPRASLLLTLLLLSSIFSPFLHTSSPATDLNLCAYRDVDYAVAPKGHPLKLTAEAYGLTDPSLTGEIVNAYGLRIWINPAVLSNGHIEASVPAIHSAGEYFFRLYGRTEKGADIELLREYAIVVE